MSLRFGYVSNGLSDHRLEHALELLAENGYTGVALTLDHIHFDPFAPRLRARAARAARGARRARAGLCGGDGRALRAGPAPQALPDAASSDGRQRRVDLLCTAVDVAAELGAPVVSMWSGVAPPTSRASAPGTCWSTAASACSRTPSASGITLAFEPEPGMLVETLADYEQLRERLGHPPALGLTLDIGHIVCLEPMSVTECVRRGAPTLAHVHIEDMRRGVHEHLMFGEGELDLDEALPCSTEIGYEGMVAVELSRHSHAAHETVPAAMAALRAAEREVGADRAEIWLPRSGGARASPRAWSGCARRAPRVAADPTAIRIALPDGRPQGRARAAGPGRRPAPTSTRGRSTTPRACCCWSALGERAEAELAELYRFGDAAERRGDPARAAVPGPRATAALGLDRRRDPHQRHAADRRRARARTPPSTCPTRSTTRPCSSASSSACPITGLDGIPTRVTPDGARMLAAFVHERVAAGRDVPAEVWTVIDKYPPAEEIAAIEARAAEPVRGSPRGGASGR